MVHKGKKAYLKKRKSTEEPQNNSLKSYKKAKIIVRNLPFKNLSEKSVEDLFKEYGEIVEVKLLKKSDGKYVGCGFVQFTKTNSAAKAIMYCNQKEIHGRKIIVDWALPKNTFLQKVQLLENTQNIKVEDSGEDESDKVEFMIDSIPDTLESDVESTDNNEESENSDTENENDDDDDDDNSFDENDSKGDIENKKRNKAPPKFKNNSENTRPSDVEEGKTLFFRNVPFSATNEDLKECVEKYGPIEYALICIDKLTEHSKGTAFVKFKDKDSAVNCLRDSANLFLNDNLLTVTTAMSRENLENKKKNKKQIKDSRNLYLVREGVVIAGSKAAAGVSASDMAKRLQLEQWKTQILKNLNMFVSKTRLVVHNLPSTYDDDKLKKLFVKFSNPKAIIKEAKVMRDKKKVDSKGNGVSKEVGFVSFTNHEDALTALRNINNNPKVFTPKRRPIVAFSVESRTALNAKQKSIEKSRAKLGIIIKDDKLSKLNRKQRRFIKRKQKIIEKRREAKKAKLGEISEPKPKPESNVNKCNKRKGESIEGINRNKKQKTKHSQNVVTESESGAFVGITSKPGQKIKMRSRFKLKTQASIHNQTLKNERRKKREEEKKKMGSIKQGKQKKGKKKLLDDTKLSKLISKHRKSIQNSSVVKKWYDK